MSDVESANLKALSRLLNSEPWLIDVDLAYEVIPKFKKNMLLHAGPEIQPEHLPSIVKRNAYTAGLFEEWANSYDEFTKILNDKNITLSPCFYHNSAVPLAEVISPSTPVFIVKNKTYGNKVYCKVFNHLDIRATEDITRELRRIRDVYSSVLKEAIKLAGGINLREIISESLYMGDDCHLRTSAGTALFTKILSRYIIETDFSKKDKIATIKFIADNERFFLNLALPAIKASLDSAHGIKNATIITAIGSNGDKVYVRISGLGDNLLLFRSPDLEEIYLGNNASNSCVKGIVIGDDLLIEAYSLGYSVIVSSPALINTFGKTIDNAMRYLHNVYEVSIGEHTKYRIPLLGSKGIPIGIDILKIVDKKMQFMIGTFILCIGIESEKVGLSVFPLPLKILHNAIKMFSEL